MVEYKYKYTYNISETINISIEVQNINMEVVCGGNKWFCEEIYPSSRLRLPSLGSSVQ